MVVSQTKQAQADRVFGALSNSTRRDIVRRTLSAEFSVSELSRSYSMSFAAVQKHVAVLQQAGLVTKRAQGREQLVSGDVDTIGTVHVLLNELEAVWRQRLDRFDETLKDIDQGATP